MVTEGNTRLLMGAVQDVIVGACLAEAESSASAYMWTLLLWL